MPDGGCHRYDRTGNHWPPRPTALFPDPMAASYRPTPKGSAMSPAALRIEQMNRLSVVEPINTRLPANTSLRDECAAIADDLREMLAALEMGLGILAQHAAEIGEPHSIVLARGWDYSSRMLAQEQERQVDLINSLQETIQRNRMEAERLFSALMQTERDLGMIGFALKSPAEESAEKLFRANRPGPEASAETLYRSTPDSAAAP